MNLPILIFISIYAFFTSFLWHELFHIKSNGIFRTGKIFVNQTSMTFTVDGKYNLKWCLLSGGLLSGILFLAVGLIFLYNCIKILYIPFLSCAFLQLCYGFFEMIYGPKYRYLLYASVIVVMVAFFSILFKLGVI